MKRSYLWTGVAYFGGRITAGRSVRGCIREAAEFCWPVSRAVGFSAVWRPWDDTITEPGPAV